ncbi:MAG: hypothetical protein QOE54_5193 [Streptosporangiaceae bacterium]|nr:hypothetical protein [Streptosporangiaceae bacterium]
MTMESTDRLRVPLGDLEVASYTPTEKGFGAPWIDVDEWRETPYPHRHVHGGFTDTATKFTVYFPTEAVWGGRLFAPIEGAHGGHDDSFGGMMGELLGGLAMTVRLGGYMLDTNQGHVGDDVDPAFGPDNTVYGFRATNECARLSKHLAAQVYGRPPEHSYVWGGSGGGRRSPGCLEWGGDVWDGAMPFMGGGNIVEHGDTRLVTGAQSYSFAAMFNTQRLLKDKIRDVVDAMSAGGSGNPFDGLDTHQREEMAKLYRLGYPRGYEYMISQPMGQIWLWCSMADDLQAKDPEYFEAFWSQPGYVGHDAPQHVEGDLLNVEATVRRTLSPRDFMENPEDFKDSKWDLMKVTAMMMAGSQGADLPICVELDGVVGGYRLGAGLKVLTGKAAGRQLYTMKNIEDVWQCDGVAEANLLRFTDVQPGDKVKVDNRAFLAFCYYYRHHAMEDPQFDFLRLDGVPIYPQHDAPDQSPLMGVPYSGQYDGKLLWIHHTHDASLWPPQGLVYREAVTRSQGDDGLRDRFCLQWSENAEHVPPFILPSDPSRATGTWLIDYRPLIEQGLLDLTRWCEEGIKPAETSFVFADGKISLPASAAERRGVQPVLVALADGAPRAEVAVGAEVTLTAQAEVPPGTGFITRVAWDLDGSGFFAHVLDVDGTAEKLELSTTHVFDKPGTFYVSCLVTAHRDGDVTAVERQLPNLAQARVVVG